MFWYLKFALYKGGFAQKSDLIFVQIFPENLFTISRESVTIDSRSHILHDIAP